MDQSKSLEKVPQLQEILEETKKFWRLLWNLLETF